MKHEYQQRINAMRLAAANFRKLGNDPLAKMIDKAVADLHLMYDPPVPTKERKIA